MNQKGYSLQIIIMQFQANLPYYQSNKLNLFMKNQLLGGSKSKLSRLLIKPNNKKTKEKETRNIFSLDRVKILKDLKEIDHKINLQKQYDICGDKQFKKTFFNDKIKDKSIKSTNQQIANQKQYKQLFTIDNNSQNQFYKLNGSKNRTFAQNNTLQETIYLNDHQKTSFISKLHETQINFAAREKKTIERFKQTQKSWQNIQNSLKLKFPKNQTVTFGSINKYYVHQNPQKLQLINDMIPAYWKNSLRNNDKRLKSYIKGHDFKHQIAQQMLQTLKGSKRLQLSIPKIDQTRAKRQFFQSKKLKLKGNKINNSEQNETMRYFYRTEFLKMNKTLQQKLKNAENSFETSNKRFKSLNRTIDNNIKQSKQSLLEELSERQKKIYDFGFNLENLDKIDNQLYKKEFEKRRKWMTEGYQIMA